MKEKRIDLLMAWANHALIVVFGLMAVLYNDYSSIVVENRDNIGDWVFATLIFMIMAAGVLYGKVYQLSK